MAIFLPAMEQVFKDEGGYVNNPNDNGGVTNWGISLRWYITVNKSATKETIAKMTKDEAEDLYFQYFWLPNEYQSMNSQKIANKVFNTTVNIGELQGNKMLQTALHLAGGVSIKVDGKIGAETIKIVNELTEKIGEDKILDMFKLLQKQYYAHIVARNPKQGIFLKTWLKRADN